MRFTTREDIERPIADVFEALTDFQGFERAAMRRGAEVQRTGEHGAKGVGQGWVIRFRHRGRQRELVSSIGRFEPPAGLSSSGRVGGYEGVLAIDLTALAPRRTRLRVDLDVKPKTLAARLMLQSLRLAKGSLANRFKARVHSFARELESRR